SQNAALSLKPLVSHKFFHDNFRVTDFYPQFLVFPEGRTVLTHNSVSLHIEHPDADRIPTTGWYYRFEHPRESERGLDPIDDLYCPCDLKYSLGPGQVASIVLSTHEGAEPFVVQDDKCAVDANLIDCLGDACSKFLVRAPGRTTIIAGYPWFADWGRDTMVALPGVCLARGLVKEAQEILRSYAGSMADGLIPNRFSDEGGQPEYNTADASLWFVNAVYQTLDVKPDMEFAIEAFKWVGEVYESHMRGTKYGIQVDPEDGLLKQGAPGVQLTWMDAKVGDWVVTPRHGKPVEVNALWINACRVLEWLADLLKLDSSRYRASADLAENSFVVKFWKESVGHFLDTVNPDDASFRPNQLIALSLPKGPNVGDKAVISLKKIKSELIACGVRTLSSTSPGYHGQFEGSLSERDAAYHQGTAWPWLLGPYVLAVLKHLGDVEEARRAISPARQWLETYGLGGIPEVFDGSEPYLAGGCPWQAWSASELLRAALAIQQFESK
ncbi:MAG: glycogen debranching enzyme N-terminal domain-containing protein, partial [Chthonomonadaceae bacterium]|nr:glycogen debranching enzyme N-terminal domain-containing protein [Chthonomonadaceae bacterium]